jgi:uncharacterized tellurite resistance protein B-like protein
MISSIRRFFEKNLQIDANSSPQAREARLPLASAALMFEVLKSDTSIDRRELDALMQVLQERFKLDDNRLEEIMTLAEEASHQATSLYEFTSLINASYGYEERVQLIENLWQIAFADAHIDRHEDHIIRRIADLVHVRHSDFIRTKLAVKATRANPDQ